MNQLTNSALVRWILSSEGLQFATPPFSDPQNVGQHVEVTSLAFGQGQGSWTLILFAHEDVALVRMYAHIVPMQQTAINEPRVLELINSVNYGMLTDSSLDYAKQTRTIRYKATFRAIGFGLPLFETRNAIQTHVVRSNYLHHLLKSAYDSSIQNPEQAIASAHFTAQRAAGQPTPYF